jgi:dihydroneopterin aldolase
VNFVEESNFKLIESLVIGIAQICLKEKKLLKVKVKVEKPGALKHAESAGVEILTKN